jgi:16S rRNA (guanine527-N7)-methyltransferase
VRELIATPGLTAIRDYEDAWHEHVVRALEGLEAMRRYDGPIVDVGSGGGSPGIPLAAALPDRELTLLESQERKAAALERFAEWFPNVRVLRGRAEQVTESYSVAVARALAPPPVAVEWCLPLVEQGGAAVLYIGPSADLDALARAAEQVGGGSPEQVAGVVVVPKIAPTPAGFPRRPGVAKKRPLA